MLNTPEEVKQDFLNLGTNKELKIDVKNTSGLTLKDFNMATSYVWMHEGEGDWTLNPGQYKPMYVSYWERSFDNNQLFGYYKYYDQVVISTELHFADVVNLPPRIKVIAYITYEDNHVTGFSHEIDTPTDNGRFNVTINAKHDTHGYIKKINDIGVKGLDTWTEPLQATIWYGSAVITVKNTDDPYKGYIEHSEPGTNLDAYIPLTLTNDNIVDQSFNMSEALCSADNIKFGLCEASYMNLTVGDMANTDFNNKILIPKVYCDNDEENAIPLGVFNVTSVKRSQKGPLVTKQLTAYDNLVRLEENAADWYTTYMFGISFNDYSAFRGIQFPRQIYSTYFNYAKNIGVEQREYYTETVLSRYSIDDIRPALMTDKYITWQSDAPRKFVKYCMLEVNNIDPTKRYVVDFTNPLGYTDAQLINTMPPDFVLHWDELGRGVGSQASILIEDSEGNRFLCNKGDYFMISPDATSFDVYIPTTCVASDNTGIRLLDDVTISKVEDPIDLTNGYIDLVYYEYPTGLIFPCESNITGRDVIRSLIEVCGAFYKLDRYGKPQFKYCTKSALYPSNDLYPADNLYPRGAGDGKLPLGMYTDFTCEDYSVLDYGKIQILKETRSSDTKSVVEWEYIGDSNKKNTYIIDDNIFYCAEEMQYDYDLMPEVGEMLENMYIRISNIGFTPCDVQAIGMPWLECGDRITLLTSSDGFESFIFSRYLSGIQLMLDNYEAKGDEKNPEINNYGYKLLGE